jgi:L-iditol 2-dehydrogenase
MDTNIPKSIRLAALTKAHTIELITIPLPGMGEDEVLVKQEACNICTTDYQQWLGLREHQGYPMAGGHEGCGIIIAKGDKVGDELHIGDRVGLTYSYCGQCRACRLGHTIECVEKNELVSYYHQSELGFYGTYGFADYFVRKARYLVKMSRDLTPGEAGFVEPVATVVNGMKKLRVKPMETVVVIGAGTMGLVNAQVARAFGARVIVSELLDKKIACARKMGFEVVNPNETDAVAKIKELTGGAGAEAVIVAVGATKANEQALEMLKYLDGRILFFAAAYPAPELKIDSNIIHYRKLELIGAFEADQADFFDAARLLNQRQIHVESLIEAQFPLEEIKKAFAAASIPGSYRVNVVLQP